MILIYLLIAILPLSESPFWGATLGDKLTPFKILGVVCFVYVLCYRIYASSSISVLGTWQARLSLVLFGAALLSGATTTTNAQTPLIAYMSLCSLLFVIVGAIDNLRKLRVLLLICVGSAAYASLYVFRGAQKYGLDRPGGAAGDANYFTIGVLPAILIAAVLVQQRERLWVRLFCLGCLCLTLLACALAASRGGFLALLVALAVLVWQSHNRFRNSLIAVLVLLPLTFLPGSPVQRLMTPNYGDQIGVDARKIAWRAGLHMIQAHPLRGVGLGRFKSVVLHYEQDGENVQTLAHNTYIEIAAELGVPVCIVFLAILASTYLSLNRLRERTTRISRVLHSAALSLQASIAGTAVASFYLSTEYQKVLWFQIGLSMCLWSLSRNFKDRRALGEGFAHRVHLVAEGRVA